MREPRPYELADAAIRKLNRQTILRLNKTAKKLLIENFDELNVMKEADTLYTALEADNQTAFRKLFHLRFAEMYQYCAGRQYSGSGKKAIDSIVEMYLTGILSDPDSVTKYEYDAEVVRKRDRAKEAVIAVTGNAQKRLELEKAIRLWNQMTQQYVDTVSDAAAVAAMKEAGIYYVQWHTQEDDKVCEDCHEWGKKIFRIDLLPNKPHWRCRCWISPVRSKK